MELWYSENHTENIKLSLKIREHIYSKQSKYQKIDIIDSFEFGKVLILDGVIMCSEFDEYIYHEMMVHIPMAASYIQNVLIIGGGDGGILREIAKYSHIKNIDMVEIDSLVVEICKKYLPSIASDFDDSRLNLYYEDGIKFIRQKQNEYDLIIVDSTDPFGPGEVLFTKEFYSNCNNALKNGGIMINQMESPFYKQDAKEARLAYSKIKAIFPNALAYQAHIPTYPSGHWLFGFSYKGELKPIEKEWDSYFIKTKYYTKKLQQGAFMLPKYVLELLNSKENWYG